MTGAHQTVIQAEAKLFSDLFSEGTFVVPWHQRRYDWKPDNIRALLHDIEDAIQDGRDCYFLGSIMLVGAGPQRWEINDGQQRMVTLSLVFAVLNRRLSAKRSGLQREGHALRMLFDLDTKGTYTSNDVDKYTPRIKPPENDAMRYNQMIRGRSIGSNGMLTTAWTLIEEFFASMSEKHLENFFDFLMDKLEVVCLRVPPPPKSDPNAIYETINCRGKKLDDLDLIRNFLYSHFNADTEHERKNSVHESLERVRTQLRHSSKASDFIRCHLQCRYGFLPKDKFYRGVREAINEQRDNKHRDKVSPTDYAFNLTEKITSPESLELFRVILNPDQEFLRIFEIDSGTKRRQRTLEVLLRELFGYSITLPLVFATLTRYMCESDRRKKKRIAKIVYNNMNRLTTFVIRTALVAPKFEPSHFETEFSNYAMEIAASDDIPNAEFTSFLYNCDRSELGVLDDSKFRNAIAEGSLKGSQQIKQFLLGINSNIQRDARLLDARKCTIEHILPKSPDLWRGWKGFVGVNPSDWVHRIGNLTLMGPTDNKPGVKFNGSFSKKTRSYQDSGVALTRQLSEYKDWSPDGIEERQQEMARVAVRVWKFE